METTPAVQKTIEALEKNNFKPLIVNTKEEALAKIKELIPAGASVMNGSSTTLHEIGYIDLLKSKSHPWNNLHDAVLAETDPAKQALLRKQSVISDFYLGSVHALTETGELVIASNSGSQLPHLAFTSPNLVLVVGVQKIVPTLTDAFNRIETHVVPLEDERMKKAAGYGTLHAKTLILHKENPAIGRNVHVLIVNESLGF
jgi:L-lactate utilization protein LutB